MTSEACQFDSSQSKSPAEFVSSWWCGTWTLATRPANPGVLTNKSQVSKWMKACLSVCHKCLERYQTPDLQQSTPYVTREEPMGRLTLYRVKCSKPQRGLVSV